MTTCEKLAKCPFYQGKMDINSGLGAMYRKNIVRVIKQFVHDIL